MTRGDQQRAAVIGGVGLVLVAGSLCWRLAPLDSQAANLFSIFVMPTITLVIGVVLIFRSRFIELLAFVKGARKSATDVQKAKLRKLIGPGIGLISLLLVGGVLQFLAPLADGRFGWGSAGVAWGLYLAGFALLLVTASFGTVLRFKEIEVLAMPS